MTSKLNKVSAEAVKRATGKNWDEWIKIIDKEDGEKLSHKEIAKMLGEKGYIKSGWWCQQVTVGYEYAKRRRTVGETSSSGYEIGVSKTIPIPAEKVWRFMISGEGLKTWLGEITSLKLEKGFRYKTSGGTTGEIRSVDPLKRLRLTWKPVGWKRSLTLQVYLLPSGNKTSIRFHQEKLSSSSEREEVKKHWQQILEKLEQLL